MTQEDKELILKDISGRLPYDLIVQITLFRNDGIKRDIDLDPHVTENMWEIIDKYHALPYLRPMGSMTEEEKHEYNIIAMRTIITSKGFVHIAATDLIDFLNAHHLDYRCLIPKGLAIEVTEENNPYKE